MKSVRPYEFLYSTTIATHIKDRTKRWDVPTSCLSKNVVGTTEDRSPESVTTNVAEGKIGRQQGTGDYLKHNGTDRDRATTVRRKR